MLVTKLKSIGLLFAVVCLLISNSALANHRLNNKEKAAEFSLKDQFGTVYDYKFPREKVSILAFGDKDGAEQLENWIKPLVEKYDTKLDIQGVAELSSVPSIARGIVRGMIKKKSKYPVMLDWKGAVSKSYKYEKKRANIILIDKNGAIVFKVTDAADSTKLDKLYKEIDKLLKENN
jgi:AhpC/TSA family